MHLVKDFQKLPTPPLSLAAVSNYSMWKILLTSKSMFLNLLP